MSLPVSDSPHLLFLAQTYGKCLVDEPAPDLTVEKEAMRGGFFPIAGLDEVGRGPLAGPVVAAAVILDPERIPDGIDDSKRLTPEARAAVFDAIMASARSVSIASISAHWIDALDIRKASLEAMRRAAAGLCTAPALCLIDGRDVPPGLSCGAVSLIKGDQRSLSIAAASIVAKVSRDRMMERCGSVHPAHGFAEHVGYSTPKHRAAIVAHGPVARLHRMSFGVLKTPQLEL